MAAKKIAKKISDPAPTDSDATAKPIAKKATKSAKKAASKKAASAPESAASMVLSAPKKAAVKPSLDAIARAAYLNYRRRVEQGLPGDSHSDWLEAERQSAVAD